MGVLVHAANDTYDPLTVTVNSNPVGRNGGTTKCSTVCALPCPKMSTAQHHQLPRVAVTGGLLVDVDGQRHADLYLSGQQITGVVEPVSEPAPHEVDVTLDASGCVVGTGLVDMFARFGEPGNEQAETWETGATAAAAGGFTTVLAQPDTTPPVSSREMLAAQQHTLTTRNAQHGLGVRLLLAGTLTVDRAGLLLAPLAEMTAFTETNPAAVPWFTDVAPVANEHLLLRALLYASQLSATVAVQPSTPTLANGTCMAEGPTSSKMGVKGEPVASEGIAVATAVSLLRHIVATGHTYDEHIASQRSALHLDRLSTATAVDMVRQTKAEGLPVSASVTADHLLLTDEHCADFDPLTRNTPPYRTETDRRALVEGVADGTIDTIVSSHSPAAGEQVDVPFAEAHPGAVGLQTAFAVALQSGLTLEQAFAATSWQPNRLLTGQQPTLTVGQPADLVVVDPNRRWTLTVDRLLSKARNTPHLGRTFTGQVRHTVAGGVPLLVDGQHCCR